MAAAADQAPGLAGEDEVHRRHVEPVDHQCRHGHIGEEVDDVVQRAAVDIGRVFEHARLAGQRAVHPVDEQGERPAT